MSMYAYIWHSGAHKYQYNPSHMELVCRLRSSNTYTIHRHKCPSTFGKQTKIPIKSLFFFFFFLFRLFFFFSSRNVFSRTISFTLSIVRINTRKKVSFGENSVLFDNLEWSDILFFTLKTSSTEFRIRIYLF